MLKISIKGIDAAGKLQRLSAALEPAKLDATVDRVALQGHRMVVEATPKRWFGQVRRGWQIQKPRDGVRVIVNDNKIMLWLEEGTRAHGPVRAKALYIPLTRAAFFGYKPGMVYGRDSILKKWVRGIEARWIAKRLSVKIRGMLLDAMKDHIRRAIA